MVRLHKAFAGLEIVALVALVIGVVAGSNLIKNRVIFGNKASGEQCSSSYPTASCCLGKTAGGVTCGGVSGTCNTTTNNGNGTWLCSFTYSNACTANQCDVANNRVCNSSGSGWIACQFGCNAGSSSCNGAPPPPAATPTIPTSSCGSGSTCYPNLATCSQIGQISGTGSCGGGLCCKGIPPTATPVPVCSSGAYRCSGTILQGCKSGAWQTVSNCGTTSTCNAQSGSCIAFTPTPNPLACTGTGSRCSGTVSQTCRSGLWVTNPACLYGCNATTGICKPAPTPTINPLSCSGTGSRCSGTQSQICRNGLWTLNINCQYGCNTATGVCSPQPTPKPTTTPTPTLPPSSCSAALGVYCSRTTSSCKGSEYSNFSTTIDRCCSNTQGCLSNPTPTPNPLACSGTGSRCSGTQSQICRNGLWTLNEACLYGCNTANGICNPKPALTPTPIANCTSALGVMCERAATTCKGSEYASFSTTVARCCSNTQGCLPNPTPIPGKALPPTSTPTPPTENGGGKTPPIAVLRCSGNQVVLCSGTACQNVGPACPAGCDSSATPVRCADVKPTTPPLYCLIPGVCATPTPQEQTGSKQPIVTSAPKGPSITGKYCESSTSICAIGLTHQCSACNCAGSFGFANCLGPTESTGSKVVNNESTSDKGSDHTITFSDSISQAEQSFSNTLTSITNAISKLFNQH